MDLTLNKALKKENFGRAPKKCGTLFMNIQAGLKYQSHTCLKLFAGSPLNDFAIFLLRDLKYFLNNFAIFLHRDLKEEAPDTLSAGSYNSQQQGK